MTALALAGWLLAAAAIWRGLVLARRLELVADAEHELRGPLAALALIAARPWPVEPDVLESQLDRARLALSDLSAARRGRRADPMLRSAPARELAERSAAGWRATGGDVVLDWRAGEALVNADPARLSQALGNLLSNALEHGRGRVALRGLRDRGRLRIEVADEGRGFKRRRRRRGARGRGLGIASQAVEEAGGRLRLAADAERTVASIELPIADA